MSPQTLEALAAHGTEVERMPRSTLTLKVDFVGMPAFRRLVEFAEAAETLARINSDDELATLVADCRADLLAVEHNQMTYGDFLDEVGE